MTAPSTPSPIRLIVADVDGCVSAGSRYPLDLELCQKAREFNERSKTDPLVPALSFCTARPLPYVECLHQAMGSHMPSLAECGVVMWRPDMRRHVLHPEYTAAHLRHFEELRNQARKEFPENDTGICIEEGKFCQLTLYPRPPMTMEEMLGPVQQFARRHHETFSVEYTHHVVNFLPPGIDKGSGLLWLCEQTGLSPGRILGVGDAAADWEFMQHCALTAAPKNAVPLIRERATWNLDTGPARCILDAYERVLQHNSSL